jgi:hypothetical protein
VRRDLRARLSDESAIRNNGKRQVQSVECAIAMSQYIGNKIGDLAANCGIEKCREFECLLLEVELVIQN